MAEPVKGLSRRDKAEATRRKILRAAHEAFIAQGYGGATITDIARRAGVAPQTVYFTFHTKPALISAAIDLAVLGEETPTIPQQTDWWAAMARAERADEALRIFIQGAGSLFARASQLSEVLRAAALTDEELQRTYRHHESLRRSGYREVIELLATKGRLRAGLDPGAAVDLLLTLVGDATYQALTSEHGWTHERVIAWWSEAVPGLLFGEG